MRSKIEGFDDADINALFPERIRRVAGVYWTPVAVARRVGQILDERRVRRVLDVGSGPGKFCVVASSRASRAAFAGVEQRPHLVAAARALAKQLEIENVTFEVGDATRVPWTDFDAFYIFNSFAENAFGIADRFDGTVELSARRRIDDVLRVERWLDAVRKGALLVTYHGLGGPIPATYDCVHVEAIGTGWLRVWSKARAKARGRSGYWVEDGDEIHALDERQLGLYLVGHSLDGPVGE